MSCSDKFCIIARAWDLSIFYSFVEQEKINTPMVIFNGFLTWWYMCPAKTSCCTWSKSVSSGEAYYMSLLWLLIRYFWNRRLLSHLKIHFKLHFKLHFVDLGFCWDQVFLISLQQICYIFLINCNSFISWFSTFIITFHIHDHSSFKREGATFFF